MLSLQILTLLSLALFAHAAPSPQTTPVPSSFVDLTIFSNVDATVEPPICNGFQQDFHVGRAGLNKCNVRDFEGIRIDSAVKTAGCSVSVFTRNNCTSTSPFDTATYTFDSTTGNQRCNEILARGGPFPLLLNSWKVTCTSA